MSHADICLLERVSIFLSAVASMARQGCTSSRNPAAYLLLDRVDCNNRLLFPLAELATDMAARCEPIFRAAAVRQPSEGKSKDTVDPPVVVLSLLRRAIAGGWPLHFTQAVTELMQFDKPLLFITRQ